MWQTLIGVQPYGWMLPSSRTLVKQKPSYVCIYFVEIDVRLRGAS